MQSVGGASENQLLFKVVPRNKAMSALQSLVGLTENVASRPVELPKHERAGRQIHPRSRWLGFAGLACIPLVGWLDYEKGPAISFALFYVPPVAMAAWFGGRRVGLIAAFASAAAWFTAGIPQNAQLSTAFIHCCDAKTRLLIYSLVALLV